MKASKFIYQGFHKSELKIFGFLISRVGTTKKKQPKKHPKKPTESNLESKKLSRLKVEHGICGFFRKIHYYFLQFHSQNSEIIGNFFLHYNLQCCESGFESGLFRSPGSVSGNKKRIRIRTLSSQKVPVILFCSSYNIV